MGVEHVTNRMGRVGSSGGEVSVLIAISII